VLQLLETVGLVPTVTDVWERVKVPVAPSTVQAAKVYVPLRVPSVQVLCSLIQVFPNDTEDAR